MQRGGFRHLMRLMLVLVAVLALPTHAASAATTDGKIGSVTLSKPGGIARQGSNGLLEFIKVYKPTVYGRYDYPTWVGWRFTVLNSADHGKTWKVVHQSSIQKDKASESKPADDFSSRRWDAPELPKGIYRVRLTALFFRPYSSVMLEGRWEARVGFYCAMSLGGDRYCEDIPSDDW